MSEADKAEYLYVYCIIPSDSGLADFGVSDIDGRGDRIRTIAHREILAVVSGARLPRYERNEENIMAHQRVIQRVLSRCRGVPMPFSTVLKDPADVQKILESRYDEFRQKLTALSAVAEETVEEPGRRLIEEALAQSFANSARIRQLNEKLSYVNSLRNGGNDTGFAVERLFNEGFRELSQDVRALREETATVGSLYKSIAEAVDGMREDLKSIQKWNGFSVDLIELEKDVRTLQSEVGRINGLINGTSDRAPITLTNGASQERENSRRSSRDRPSSAEEH